jgi:hypothetical protein
VPELLHVHGAPLTNNVERDEEIAMLRQRLQELETGFGKTATSDGSDDTLAGPSFTLPKEHIEKFSTKTEFYSYGDEKAFINGLPLKREDIRRSIAQECCENAGGLYKAAFFYVTLEPARECEDKDPATGKIRIKEQGHDGMTLQDFANLDEAQSAGLKIAHIVVIRLYTGKLYKPWNGALRGMAATNEDPLKKEKLLEWATCIAVLYEAIIILSTKTKPATVFRGLDESKMALPDEFFSPEKSKSGFAGGVEMAFMSTTEDKQVECKCRIRLSDV